MGREISDMGVESGGRGSCPPGFWKL